MLPLRQLLLFVLMQFVIYRLLFVVDLSGASAAA